MEHADRVSSSVASVAVAMLLFLLLFVIYAGFPSQQRNMDGPYQDIDSVTHGSSDPSARHFLYTYVAVPWYRLWQGLGYSGDAARPMLQLNALCGALGICGFYVFLVGLGMSCSWASLLSLFYGLSYVYWTFTTDAFYNTFAAMPVLWSLPVLLHVWWAKDPHTRAGGSLLLAALGTFAILATQEHVLFVPVLVIGLLAGQTEVSLKTRLVSLAVYLGGLLIMVVPLYTLRAIQVRGCTTVQCVIAWLRPYGELIPMYQSFAWDRIPAAAWSFLAAMVPLWRGMALRDLARGIITPSKILPQLALFSTLSLLGYAGLALLIQRKRAWSQHRAVVILCLGWLMISIPPIIWLDPYGPERWIVSLAPVVTLIAVALNLGSRPLLKVAERAVFAVGLAVLILIASANLIQEIWPNHTVPNSDIAVAEVAAAHMGVNDIIVSPKWDWTIYLETQERQVLSLLDLSMKVAGRDVDAQRLLDSLDVRIDAVQIQGGRVFLVDVFSYSQSDWAWIEENTGLRLEYLERYRRIPAWQFHDEQIWELLGPAQN